MPNLQDLVLVNCRNIKLTDAMSSYIDKKMVFLDRFAKYIERISVEIADNIGESNNLKYEVTLIVKSGFIRVEEKGTDLYRMIDLAHDKLKIKVDKYKEKLTDHNNVELSEIPVEEEVIISEEEETFETTYYEPKITKRKIYSDNRPLHPEEAIEQMEMIGHSCFLFKNIDTNKYTMVYKRDDGNYGLVEPEST